MWQLWFGRKRYQAPNGALVYENPRYRWLMWGGMIHACIHKKNPERPILEYVKPFISMIRQKPGNVCLLGVGGLAVVHAMKPYLGGFKVDAVDDSEDIIHIARHYFSLGVLDGVGLVHDDACRFVQQSPKRYQQVLVDLFDATAFPTSCHHVDFFKTCRDLLLPDGVLVVNAPHVTLHQSIFGLMQSIFERQMLVVPIPKTANVLFFGFNDKDRRGAEEAFVRQYWDPFWGWMG